MQTKQEQQKQKQTEKEMRRLKDKYVSPFTDFGFKKLFGTDCNKELLIDFLNELLRKDEGRIVDLTYLPTEQLGRTLLERRAIYDIYCETEQGEKFIVELQRVKQTHFKDRSIYYSTFPIQDQAITGKWDFQLKAVYMIGILDFVFDDTKDDTKVFHHEVQLFDKATKSPAASAELSLNPSLSESCLKKTSTQEDAYSKLTYIYLELPKFKKSVEELETHFEKWLYILKNLPTFTSRPPELQEKSFDQLFRQAELANYSDGEYKAYEASLKIYRDNTNTDDTLRAEGRTEKQIEVAKRMKQKGYSLEEVAEMTGLSVEEIEKMP